MLGKHCRITRVLCVLFQIASLFIILAGCIGLAEDQAEKHDPHALPLRVAPAMSEYELQAVEAFLIQDISLIYDVSRGREAFDYNAELARMCRPWLIGCSVTLLCSVNVFFVLLCKIVLKSATTYVTAPQLILPNYLGYANTLLQRSKTLTYKLLSRIATQ